MKNMKILIGGTLLTLLIAFNIGNFENKVSPDNSLNTMFLSASASGENGELDKIIVTVSTTIQAEVELCGDAAASYLGLVSGSISGCISVMINRTTTTTDCPSPGNAC